MTERPSIRPIQDYTGREVEGAGQFYTAPLILQHKYHFSKVSFKVAPLAHDYEAILPCWWLAKHKCDLLASNVHIMFTSPDCQQRCTEANQKQFPLTPTQNGKLRTLAAATEDELQAAIDRVHWEYSEFIAIMTTEASLEFPKHSAYKHTIDFKDGSIQPWGTI